MMEQQLKQKEAINEFRVKMQDILGYPVTVKVAPLYYNVTIEELKELVTGFTNTSWEHIASPCRKQKYIIGRHLFCYIANTLMGKTLNEIANELRLQNHTTALHAREKVKDLIETKDEMYIKPLERILKQMGLIAQFKLS